MSKIGVFDSGLGGLTVVTEIKKRFPKSQIIYLGDTARVPYGTRSAAVVQKFAVEDAKFLESKGVSQIIIACNTASALAFKEVKAAVSVSVHEVISPAKIAAEKIGKNIGVIGTRGTIRSRAYGHTGVACPLLVPFVEEGDLDSPALRLILQNYLSKFTDIDTLILGCTHYPYVSNLIQELLPQVKLINPGEELAKILDLPESEGEDEYYVTDLTQTFLSQGIGLKLVEL